jgi:P pilus assembly chaperone PapD
MRHRILTLFLPFFIFCISPPVLGAIAVSPVILVFDEDHRSQDFSVINQDPQKIAYVAITMQQAKKADASQPKTTLLNDPRKTGLLISPAKLALPPGGSRRVRVSLTRPPQEQEQRYMLAVTPQEGELTMLKSSSEEKDIRTAIHVIIAYGVQIIVPPINPHTKLSLTRNGREITATNQGNTVVVLHGKQQCATPDKCENLDGRYELAPGTTQKITVPKALPATFVQRTYDNSEQIVAN